MTTSPRSSDWILWTTTIVGAIGLLAVAPTPTVGQTSPNGSPQQEFPQEKRQATTVKGRLDSNSHTFQDKRYYNVHTFEGRAGESVTINLTSDEFDGYLILIDPDGKGIAGDDNGGGGNNAKITATLPTTGIYEIGVIAIKAGESGNYTLSWREASAAELELASVGALELAEAEQLNQQVIQLYNQGQYRAAIPLAERALAIRERLRSKEHPDVDTSLYNLASLYDAMGNYSQAEPLYQRSLAIREKVLGQDSPVVANTLNALGSLYYKQGNDSQAEPLFQRALAIQEKVLGQEHPDVANSLNGLASLYYEQGNYSQAEPLFRRALAIREKVLGQEHPDFANSLHNLGLLYQEQRNYSQAVLVLQRALAIREKVLGQEHPLVANSLNGLASLYYEQGNYSQAEPLFQRALAIREKVLGQEHPDVANSLNGLALLYQAMGNHSQAVPLFQRALAIREKILGQEHPDFANSLHNLGLLYQEQGNYSQAVLILQRALAIREKVLGQEHPLVANTLNALASLYQDEENYTQVESLVQRALTIQEKVLGKEHPDVANSLNGLALLYYEQGNYSQAVPILQRALAILEKAQGQEHPFVANSLNTLAVQYQAQGDIARAIEFKTRSTNIQERNLALILATGSEDQKSAYIATLSGTTSATVSLHVQDAPNNPQALRLALTTILRRKGRVLDALTDNLRTLRQNLKPEDQTLLDKLAATRSKLSALRFQQTRNLAQNQYSQVATLEVQANQLEATLVRRNASFRTASQPVTIEAVQQLIPPEAALVELVSYYPFNPKSKKRNEKWGAPRYVAYVLHSKGAPQWVDLGEAESINQSVAEFRTAIQSDASNIQPVARALDEKLMQPIRKLLGNTRNLLIAPDSQLNLIPFAALVDENNRYLVQNYTISYLSSGRDLLRLQNHTKSRSVPVIVANPNYAQPGDPTSVEMLTTGGASQNVAESTLHQSTPPSPTRNANSRLSIDLAQQPFDPLPNTVEEAKAIAALLPRAKLLAGSQATENVIKQLHGPQILHIATHGFFLQDRPLLIPQGFGSSSILPTFFQGFQGSRIEPVTIKSENPLVRSGVALAGANLRSSGSEDGILTALEAAGLDLSGTKLVVLSACKTGLGDVQNGEGVYGLRRAFAIAGAESQLMSLWAVNDYRTNQLMVKYYQRLKNHVGRSEALRQTQLEMLRNPDSQHPYYWAAFIPSGDWTPMEF